MDSITGLPELPEGYFWRVEKANIRALSRDYYSFDSVDGAIVRLVYRETIVVPKGFLRPERFSIKEKSVAQGDVMMEVKRGAPGARRDSGYSDRYISYDVTPESVLDAAKKVYYLWQQGIERKKIEDEKAAVKASLLGDYPPKTLTQKKESK